MYYIQRFKDTKAAACSEPASIARMLDNDYMGSSEFEQGAGTKCFRWLRSSKLSIFPVKKVEGKVTFYVVGTEASLERFNAGIDKHLDGKYIGIPAKEWTGLYERFVSKAEILSRMYKEVNAWMDIAGGMGYRGSVDEIPPVLFTADRFLAIRMYLELTRKHHVEDHFELNMFDKAYCWKSKQLQTIAGLNEDDSVTLKAFGKKQRVSKYDVWPEKFFPLEQLKSFGVF